MGHIHLSGMTALLSAILLQSFLLINQPVEADFFDGVVDLSHYGDTTVGERFEDIGILVDFDGDGEVTQEEVSNWLAFLETQVEGEVDLCLTEGEWVSALVEDDFTTDFATELFVTFRDDLSGSSSSSCDGIDIEALTTVENTEYPMTRMEFLDAFLVKIIEFCQTDEDDDDDNDDRYTTNEDCETLPETCVVQPFLCEGTCLTYTFVTTTDRSTGAFSGRDDLILAQTEGVINEGSFAEKVEELFVDENEDGLYSVEEQQVVYETYDLDGNGCVEQGEFIARYSYLLCDGLGFSMDYAITRFEELAALGGSSDCMGIKIDAVTEEFTLEELVESSTNTLMNMCEEEDDTPEDCGQLSTICGVDDLTSDTQACEDWLADPSTGNENTLVKFYNNFLQVFGEEYEDFDVDAK